MADEDTGGAGEGEQTYTQDELDHAVAEANKSIEAHRDKVLGELKTVKAKLKAFDGVDPAEYQELRDRLSELEQQKSAEKAGLTSEELAKLREDVQRATLEKYAADADAGIDAFPWAKTLADEVRALRLDTKVKAAMAKGGARAERIDALFTLTRDRFGLTDDGQPMLVSNPGLEIENYVSDALKGEYPEFYNGSGSSGGGASKSTAGGGGVKTIARDDGAAFLANLDGIAAGEVTVK